MKMIMKRYPMPYTRGWLVSLLLVCLVGAGRADEAGSPSATLWLTLHATQPHVSTHTPQLSGQIPYNLFGLILGAVPPEYRLKAKEMGFNLIEVQNALNELAVGDSYSKLSEGTQLTVRKEVHSSPEKATMIIMTLDQPKVGVRFRLSMSSSIIRFLTGTFPPLQGLEKVMDSLLQEIRNLPPGVYLTATDGFKTFQITLE